MAGQDLGPAWRALAHDGRVRRSDVWLDATPSGIRTGAGVAARDVGHRTKVIGSGFQVDWFLVPLFVLAGAVVLLIWAYTVWRALSRRSAAVPPSRGP
jgi:hypothetical protein